MELGHVATCLDSVVEIVPLENFRKFLSFSWADQTILRSDRNVLRSCRNVLRFRCRNGTVRKLSKISILRGQTDLNIKARFSNKTRSGCVNPRFLFMLGSGVNTHAVSHKGSNLPAVHGRLEAACRAEAGRLPCRGRVVVLTKVQPCRAEAR